MHTEESFLKMVNNEHRESKVGKWPWNAFLKMYFSS